MAGLLQRLADVLQQVIHLPLEECGRIGHDALVVMRHLGVHSVTKEMSLTG